MLKTYKGYTIKTHTDYYDDLNITYYIITRISDNWMLDTGSSSKRKRFSHYKQIVDDYLKTKRQPDEKLSIYKHFTFKYKGYKVILFIDPTGSFSWDGTLRPYIEYCIALDCDKQKNVEISFLDIHSSLDWCVDYIKQRIELFHPIKGGDKLKVKDEV